MSLRHRTRRTASELVCAALWLCLLSPASAQVRQESPANSKDQRTVLAKAQRQLAGGELGDAETSLWTVLTANPNDEDALTLLATIRGRQQRYAEAEALFRRVLQIDPNSGAAHRGLGSALIAENKAEDAIEQYKAAIDVAPKDLGLKVELADLYAGHG